MQTEWSKNFFKKKLSPFVLSNCNKTQNYSFLRLLNVILTEEYHNQLM